MAKLFATVKAIITRIIFGTHGFLAIWQVTQYKKDPVYWYLCAPIVALFFEGIFTLAIKKNQEWRWFCPSVFLYLGSVVPAIWLLELSKLESRAKVKEETINFAAVGADLKNLDKYLGVAIKLPDIEINSETWIMLIEQFLMLILIIGRWMLPKGDLTRDQLSQLLLVYIGTAADIIEFFDSFKDNTIANETLLVFLTLGIWSWSLLQFTIVLSATRARKTRGGGLGNAEDEESNCCNSCCCTIDVWGIALNIVLQDAPFLTFRLLIILHYRIISYMNVFFTCKNTLVIMLQLYRLQVVYSENSKNRKKREESGKKRKITHKRQQQLKRRQSFDQDDDSIYVISTRSDGNKRMGKRNVVADSSDDYYYKRKYRHKNRQKSSTRKDTGYSTASSQTTLASHKKHHVTSSSKSKKERAKSKNSQDYDDENRKSKDKTRKKLRHSVTNSSDEERNIKRSRKSDKTIKDVEELSENSSAYEVVNEKHSKRTKPLPPPPPPLTASEESSSVSEE